MTPKRLICREAKGGAEKGPASLPKETSIYKYESITKGCSKEERMFDEADLRLTMEDSKPIKKTLAYSRKRMSHCCLVCMRLQLSEFDPAAAERPGNPGLMTRKNKQKL